ncbi:MULTISPECIES: TetR/AcrR family transcriptional regulator [Desulfitobacterium]|uniref:Transcriptional regulator n=1 Tax=Desulfitobacterium dehalogenans (strain ATCC 51507 / DSM 9161 / JW/IU-DC1) TaxID=756499 RepID=I4A7T9_DESDJ|nr:MULTISPECIES: TetR/AcrR family transcriptional regulator [Desulfitobacterium]AFM00024.1 transcriptional regulator [Desulfitobacterium dehalogenans ATCC 51507]
MKREEKNLRTRQKIMQGALAEFGEKGYEQAALNDICKRHNLSKGIIYHYFKSKDELYLGCVEECFAALIVFLRKIGCEDGGELEKGLQSYFDARLRFFSQNPCYFKIFCDVITNPPGHLKTAIAEIKKDFDELNVRIFTRILSRTTLRNGISLEEAVENLCRFQNYFNLEYQRALEECPDIKALPKLHEENCRKFVDILFYGIIERV